MPITQLLHAECRLRLPGSMVHPAKVVQRALQHCFACGTCLQVTAEDVGVREEAARVATEQARAYKEEYLIPARQGNCSVGVSLGSEWKTLVSLLHMNTIKLVRSPDLIITPCGWAHTLCEDGYCGTVQLC